MTRKVFYIVFGLILAFTLVAIAPAARADQWDQSSQVTFNQPVEMPGNMVLPAGTYWFEIANDGATPSLVQVFNADQTQVLATIQAIPTDRSEATDRGEYIFSKQSQGHPIALISWFYPGLLTGHEFVYQPSEETRLSRNEQVTVTG
jgi:hypothetical protein